LAIPVGSVPGESSEASSSRLATKKAEQRPDFGVLPKFAVELLCRSQIHRIPRKSDLAKP